jgi:hypothetical protein
MRLLTSALISGFVTSVVVTWWPSSWLYAPGIIFGATIAIYFSQQVWREYSNKWVAVFELIGFVGWSYLAYTVALIEAEWVLGTNGFATFSSYSSRDAASALFVGCFVGGCIGAFMLALVMRWLFFKFDLVRGLFLFVIFSGTLGSVIIFGFETFGFIPQFLFPAWYLGVAGVTLYLRLAKTATSEV